MPKLSFALFILLFCSFTSVFAQQRTLDIVYLKNGMIVRGVIIENIPDVSIKIQLRDRSIHEYSSEEIEKIVRKPLGQPQYRSQTSQTLTGSEKSPGIAFILSFIFPGLGQYYNGQPVKGVIQEVLVVGGVVAALAAGTSDDCYTAGSYPYQYTSCYQSTNAVFWVGLGGAAAASLWSMIDAPLSASSINKRLRQQSWGHMIEMNNAKYGLGLDLTPKKQGFGASLTLHF